MIIVADKEPWRVAETHENLNGLMKAHELVVRNIWREFEYPSFSDFLIALPRNAGDENSRVHDLW